MAWNLVFSVTNLYGIKYFKTKSGKILRDVFILIILKRKQVNIY